MMKIINQICGFWVISLWVSLSLAQAPSIDSLNKEIELQKQAISSLEATYKEKKQAYDRAKTDYQKIKSVSRDWNRRNKAEETYQSLQSEYWVIQKQVSQAISKLNTLSSNLELANTLKANQPKPVASTAMTPKKKVDAFFQGLMLPTLALIFLAFVMSFTLVCLDLFKSFMGWFMIIGSKGFRAGDRIEISNIYGDIIHVGFLRTSLLEVTPEGQSTGNIIFIPNHLVLKHPINKHVKQFVDEKSQLKKVS